MVTRHVIRRANSKAPTSEALDVAARYLVYKLHDGFRSISTPSAAPSSSWQSVRGLDETAATVGRAVERGWVVIRDGSNKGKAKARAKDLWAALTEEGRAVARKGLR